MLGGRGREQRKTQADGARGAPRSSAHDILGSVETLRTNWFWSTDADGRISYISEWLAEQLTTSGDGLIHRELTDMFRAEGLATDANGSIGYAMARRKAFRAMNVRSPIDPEERIWTISGTPQLDASGMFIGFRGVGADVTAIEQSAGEIARLASYDTVTGLRNRRGMASLVEQAIARAAAAREPTPFSVLLIDLDRFKQVNDTLGHPAGDQLLIQVADRLKREVANADCIGRIGGDEFLIVFPDCPGAEALELTAASIIEGLSKPYFLGDSRCVIGASIGIVRCEVGDETPEAISRNADLALYAAKRAGRGCARFFTNDMAEAAKDRRSVEQDLLDALDRGQLEVNYQPLVTAATNRVAGFEALLRWNHPTRGRISPALFIPIAEETNLIVRLGEWTLRQACMDAAGWPGELRVAVNISPIQFANPNLPQIVVSALAASGLRPDRLELEITESVFLDCGAQADKMFETLKKIGVRLALDDFGTGYSSLGYLQSTPFDKIKIDQSFVRDASKPGSRNSAIISAIVTLANALGMDTTAEGVETVDQLETMRALGVGLIQGYLYSLPVNAETVANAVGGGEWDIQPIGPAKQREHRLATFRRIGAVHEDHYYPVILRNLSSTGALIQGIVGVPEGTRFIIDFGERRWMLATVRRSHHDHQGIEFDEALVPDGQGGFRPRYQVSATMLTRTGLVLQRPSEGGSAQPTHREVRLGLPTFATSGV
ncbi:MULTISPECIES: putative bifunctional diguanylate cyclase/phosphodiesterase [unclassified Sphingomonas]|uniref:putative bifunctional diguanylate cyclase/phosphodiesterase n=1 Tax=unclassified Sphingomonas TaxID=196159 RepID=UPI00082A7EE2|nr:MULTISPECIES: EAL domain-containing protein [unclassified Sphingomonas]